MTRAPDLSAERLRPAGFTLLELLLAVTLLAAAFSIAYGTFSAATHAWRRGTQVADALGEGDLVMERLVAALRSAVYFPNEDPRYGFRHESMGLDPPADRISWVTSASGFLPPDAPLAQAAYRIEIAFDPHAADGPVLVQRAWRHLIEEPEEAHVDERIAARSIRGFRVRVHDTEQDDWIDEWAQTNAIPHRVEVTLLLPGDGGSADDDVIVQRHVEIPIAPLSTAPPMRAAPARRPRR